MADPRGERKSGHGPMQFGYRLWPSSIEEINVRYCETYQIGPPAECWIDVPPQPNVWIRKWERGITQMKVMCH